MKRRLILGGILFLIVGTAAVFFDRTHILRGRLLGETFHAGRPESYWRRVMGDEDSGTWRRLKETDAETIPFLIEELKEGNNTARERAAALLGHKGPAAKVAAPLLLEVVKGGADAIDPEIIRVMKGIDLEKVKRPGDTIRLDIPNDDFRLRYSAAEALRDIDREAAVKAGLPGEPYYADQSESYWRRALADADHDVWKKLKDGGPETIPFLIQQLKKGDDISRERSAALLGEKGKAAKDAVPTLLLILKTEKADVDPEIIRVMKEIDAEKKKRPGEAIKIIIEDSSLRLRYSAAEALRDIDPEAAKKAGLP